MQNALNPLVSMYQTQLEASRRFADAVFSGTEKIDHVMIEATHHAFTEQLKFAHALASAGDPRSVGSTLQSGILSRAPDNAIHYQKEIMQAFSEAQSGIGRSLQEYIQQLGAHAATSASAPLQDAQAQAKDVMLNPVTSMFSVWESAFKEVAALAKKNMMNAEAVIENAADRSREQAAGYATAMTEAASSAGARNSGIIIEDSEAGDKRGGASSSGGGKKK